jgi:hypothetical protein
MTDSHVHIGQFEDVYYDPIEIADIVMSSGMEGMSFSSVSSCMDDVPYARIEKEISRFLSRIPYSAETVRPYFWYVPNYISQNVTLDGAFASIPYKGIKIHPYAQSWDFGDSRHWEILHKIFGYASLNNLPVLIHTGHSGVDSADRFEGFVREYSSAKCVLAHCRPLGATIEMLQKYSNAYCDTSFAPKVDIRRILSCGLKDRIIFGSDFPVTHYFRTKYPSASGDSQISLKAQYAEDICGWEALFDEWADELPNERMNER